MPTTGDGSFAVDVDAIEDFQPVFRRLEARSSTASSKASPASAQGLGTFPQAQQVIAEHGRLLSQYLSQLEQLRTAVAVANDKTSRLIANYRRTESGEVANMGTLRGGLPADPS